MQPRQFEETPALGPIHQQITGIQNANPLMPDICLWHIEDIDADEEHVRFWG